MDQNMYKEKLKEKIKMNKKDFQLNLYRYSL